MVPVDHHSLNTVIWINSQISSQATLLVMAVYFKTYSTTGSQVKISSIRLNVLKNLLLQSCSTSSKFSSSPKLSMNCKPNIKYRNCS